MLVKQRISRMFQKLRKNLFSADFWHENQKYSLSQKAWNLQVQFFSVFYARKFKLFEVWIFAPKVLEFVFYKIKLSLSLKHLINLKSEIAKILGWRKIVKIILVLRNIWSFCLVKYFIFKLKFKVKSVERNDKMTCESKSKA